MKESIEDAVVDFNNQSTITRGEFKAWLAGIVVAVGDQPMSMCIADAIVTMALRIQPDQIIKTEPSTLEPTQLRNPQPPYTIPQTPHTPYRPEYDPRYPGIPPIWCNNNMMVGETTHNTTNTGSTNGSKT